MSVTASIFTQDDVAYMEHCHRMSLSTSCPIKWSL